MNTVEVTQIQTVVHFKDGRTETSDWFNNDIYANMYLSMFKREPDYSHHEFKKRQEFITIGQELLDAAINPFTNPDGKYYTLYHKI